MKLHIAFYIPGLPFGPDTLTKSSLGGSETAGLSMAKALADRGHRVYLFCNTNEAGLYGNLQFHRLEEFQKFITFIHHDVCVVQRVPAMFCNRTQSKLNVAWMHDMALGRNHGSLTTAMWNIDQVALLSDYMVEQYRDVYGDAILNDAVLWKTRNGIDLSLFPKDRPARDRKLLVYAARPERGLDYLLDNIFPKLLRADPQIRLAVCGYENPATELSDFYAAVQAKMQAFGDRIVNAGHFSKPELYGFYNRAGCYVYPTPTPMAGKFREVSCITAMECMAAGLPFVSSKAGALPETLNRAAGTLINKLPGEEGYDDAFVRAVLKYVNDDEAFEQASKAGRRAARRHQWSKVAEEWETNFIEQIRARNDSKPRLAAHFRRHGDYCAAQRVDGVAAPAVTAHPQEPAQVGVIQKWLADSKDVQTCWTSNLCKPLVASLPAIQFKQEGLCDAGIVIGSLEYSDRPWDRIGEAQANVKTGGWIYLSAPFGPHRLPRLWNLESADIEDMAGHLPGFDLLSLSSGSDPETAEVIGWSYCRFRNDGKVKPVDLTRKLSLQRPRQTLSVNIIAGGPHAEDTIRWCLSGVKGIADEIVIADCGMTPTTKAIAAEFGAKIIEGKNPIEHGFETPRNMALEASTCDWVLWIDTDERVIGPEFLTKYLRFNCFDGFSVKQHHVGVDIDYNPDMPVRLFRRGPQRFFGMIHEHPEKELNKGPGTVVILSDVNIMHIGYTSEKIRQARFWRNAPLLEKDKEKYPDRLLQKHFIMRDLIILSNADLGANGGQVTRETAERCEQVIELWRKYFKGGCDLAGVDSLQYYSRALQILGRGIDVEFTIQAARDGIGAPINGSAMRFENKDDLMSEIKWRTERTAAPFLRENW